VKEPDDKRRIVRHFVDQYWPNSLLGFVALIVSVDLRLGFGWYPIGELRCYHWQLIMINTATCDQATLSCILLVPY
jgi:hypothetical protein